MKELLPNKMILQRGDVNWLSHSPDLSPLDYFLWEFLKEKVYKNKLRILTQLKQNITAEIAQCLRLCAKVY